MGAGSGGALGFLRIASVDRSEIMCSLVASCFHSAHRSFHSEPVLFAAHCTCLMQKSPATSEEMPTTSVRN